MPRVVARSHPLVPARQVLSCSPTSSCWCFAASPSSSWSSPSGSSPARAASASGGSAPCSKVRGCPSPPAHASTGRLPAQPPACGTPPPHTSPVCPLHTHLWHIAQPRTGASALHSPHILHTHHCLHCRGPLCTHLPWATLPCTHSPPGVPCAHYTRPCTQTHPLCTPPLCICIHCRHYTHTHIPAHATCPLRITLAEATWVP